jgi:hypothetical protein
MRVFKDVISGDEMFSDSFPFKEIDDIVYEVEAKFVVVKEGDYGIGANADEDADEGATAEAAADGKTRVVDVVHQNRLTETSFDKKSFGAYIKGYLKKVNDALEASAPDRCAPFKAGAAAFVRKVLGAFDEFQFFIPPVSDEYDYNEGIIVLAKWEGEVAKFYFWKDGLKGQRV